MDSTNHYNAVGAGAGASAGAGTTTSPSHSLPPAPLSGSITPVVDQPTYTFIDHDDDLCSKKIKNSSSRKAIRSHVMRDVRRRERLAGLKRGTKRDTQEKRSQPNVASKPVEDSSTERTSACWTTSPSSSSTSSSSTIEEFEAGSDLLMSRPIWQQQQQQQQQSTSWSADYSSTVLSPTANVQPNTTTWFPAPQRPMRSADCIPTVVVELIYYWRNAFVPATFPNGQNAMQRAGMGLMIKSVFSDPGSFFAVMYMCAAHRAVLSGRFSAPHGSVDDSARTLHDPDYYILKERCIREMEAKVRDPNQAVSNEALETVIGLLTGAIIVGLFSEVRIHLQGLKRLVEMRGGITSGNIRCSSILAAILAVDVKASAGLMTKPVFPLIWASNPVPSHARDRIKPLNCSQLGRFGTAFYANPLISGTLRRIIHVLREVALYSETNETDPTALLPEDHTFFRLLACEAEHQLLSYEFPESQRTRFLPLGSGLELHPVEAVIRTAAICYINHFLIVSLPSSGLGRAVADHVKKAVGGCLDVLSQLPEDNYPLITWALFVGARGSLGEVGHQWYVERLARMILICGWCSWDEAMNHLSGYIYVPHLQNELWGNIWSEIMVLLFPTTNITTQA